MPDCPRCPVGISRYCAEGVVRCDRLLGYWWHIDQLYLARLKRPFTEQLAARKATVLAMDAGTAHQPRPEDGCPKFNGNIAGYQL